MKMTVSCLSAAWSFPSSLLRIEQEISDATGGAESLSVSARLGNFPLACNY